MPANVDKRGRRELARIARERARRRVTVARKVKGVGLTLAAVFVIVAIGALLVRSGQGGVRFEGDIRPGGTLQELRLPALQGGGEVDYATISDRPAVINFFASWCPNCIAEMPGFEKVHEALGDRVAFLGISQSDSRDGSISLAHQTGITYPAGVDAQGAFFAATGSTGMPTTLFVLPGGKIAYMQVGALDEASLRAQVARYLGVQA
jgi:thiol-disulfide isomerase/thioredoxin